MNASLHLFIVVGWVGGKDGNGRIFRSKGCGKNVVHDIYAMRRLFLEWKLIYVEYEWASWSDAGKFHLEMQIGKVLFYVCLSFCVTGGKQRRFMLMLWIVGTIPKQKCSCMAIYSHKPSPWWPKMICELCFTWKIDILAKQTSTVVCPKCKQRSWWNNKINDTQSPRFTLSLAFRPQRTS